MLLPWPLPFPLPVPEPLASGIDLYCPFDMLGFCVAWLSILESLPLRLAGRSRRSLTSGGSCGRSRLTRSCRMGESVGSYKGVTTAGLWHTSNDCAYQSLTLPIEGISLRPSGRSWSSCTRCANRIGSSSERNCDARKRVPADGFSPNCTI